MTDFLDDIARELVEKHPRDMHRIALVFPNRRAGLFFRRYLTSHIQGPVWEPAILSLEDFIEGLSSRKVPDQLSLILELYKVFIKHVPELNERLDRFFFWGQVLLNDFNDVDTYMVDHELLFKVLLTQQEMEQQFSYMEDENLRLLMLFWETFGKDQSSHQQQFVKLWQKMPSIYEEFNAVLKSKEQGYKGSLLREIAEGITTVRDFSFDAYWFAGFNALSPAEETILAGMLEKGNTRIFWDADAYYVQNPNHEAGFFLRKYLNKNPFSLTFPKDLPNRFEGEKDLHITGVPLQVGQVKKAAEVIKELASQPGFEPERTVVVLPEEHLLLPLLQSLPTEVDQLNVTMGFSLQSGSIYTFFEHLFSLYQNASGEGDKLHFYYRDVRNLLSHSILSGLYPDFCEKALLDIVRENRIRIAASDLAEGGNLAKFIFSLPDDWLHHTRELLLQVYDELKSISIHPIEGECIYHLHTQLNRLSDILQQQQEKPDLKSFRILFRQISKSIRLVFEGEPLKGLQIMGLLETRLLDFDHVIFLSMNEGVLPDTSSGHSFIPFNLRKAFELPTPEHKDAIAAYHVYRLLQRSKKIHAFYNTETEGGVGNKGEMSRFLLQMMMEGITDSKPSQLSNPIRLSPAGSIGILKDQRSLEALMRFTTARADGSSLSPSALNTYLSCRLRFYFKYILNLEEEIEPVEEIDPRIFGNVLHNTLERMYLQLMNEKGSDQIEAADFERLAETSKDVLLACFCEEMKLNPNSISGVNLIAYKAMEAYLEAFLKVDKGLTPFRILGLEENGGGVAPIQIPITENASIQARITGKIDRIDEIDSTIRVIDYKTGKADNAIKGGLGSLTNRSEKNRNPYGFQIFLYALMVSQKREWVEGKLITGGIIGMRSMTDQKLKLDGKEILDMNLHLEAFKSQLTEVVQEIFDASVPWDQVDDPKTCSSCPYDVICRRG
jgi:hypothetical protein